MATKFSVFSLSSVLLLLLLCFNIFNVTFSTDFDSEDLGFLQEDQNEGVQSHQDPPYTDFENYDDLLEEEESYRSGEGGPDESSVSAIDESDVVVLKESNFSDFVAVNKYVMVEFHAPWCGHCKGLAPEYAAAATELKKGGEAVVLAKVDATEESELGQKYGVEGYPTLLFFVDGVHQPYSDQKTKDAIVTWTKKKTGPNLHNLMTTEDAERILTAESKIVLGFLNTLEGPESEVLADTSKMEDDVNFYQTISPNVAKLFHIDPQGKRPALVMIKKESEKINQFDGQFTKSAIAEFIFKNKLPLVTNFTRESGTLIFENPIKKQLILFATSNDYEKLIPKFQEAAKGFRGKIIFVYVDLDNEDVGKSVSDYFGITGDAPRVIAFTGNEDDKKFVLEVELTLSSIHSFGENFLEDNLKPFYKSAPIPETNDGDVKIVVGKNFDDIVLDESKDVLLEIYDPWCGHCQALEPIYNKLGKHLRGINSLVIAKMDGTKNEHPRAKPDGFPTFLFFPAGNKSFDPITVETDRTVVAFFKFLKQNAAIPFKLKKPASTQKSNASDVTESHKSSVDDKPKLSIDDVKDEL